MSEAKIIPMVGMSGTFTLRNPFDAMISEYDEFTIQAIRTISEYMIGGKDPQKDIYEKYGLGQEDWEKDFKANNEIVSMQSEVGQWIHVPVRFISSYPRANGIKYQSFSYGLALPAMPVDVDYGFFEDELRTLVTDALGVDCNVDSIVTSRIALVPEEQHAVTQTNRNNRKENTYTSRTKLVSTQAQLDRALQKIEELEQYIKSKVL